jgi:hypothetical protein
MTPTQGAAKSNFPGPLDYTSSSKLMNDMDFRGRIKVACLHFAAYIQGEDPSVPAHNTRFTWQQQCMQNPDMMAGRYAPAVVGDPNVQSLGDTIDDAALQTATETAIQKQL